MQTEQEIIKLRKRVLEAAAMFGERHGQPFMASHATAEQLHFMALGALSFADEILGMIVPSNLENLLVMMEDDNARSRTGPTE